MMEISADIMYLLKYSRLLILESFQTLLGVTKRNIIFHLQINSKYLEHINISD